MRLKAATISISLLFMLSGCIQNSNKVVVEDISPLVYYYFYEEDDQLIVTTMSPPLSEDKKKLIKIEFDQFGSIDNLFNRESIRDSVNGQLRIVFIDQKYAEQGIVRLIKILQTTPYIRQRLFIITVKGDFNKYMEKTFEDDPKYDFHLYNKLNHLSKVGGITNEDLHFFSSALGNNFSDPFTGFYEIKDNKLTYMGTAFYKDDQLVNTIDYDEDGIFQILNNNIYTRNITLKESKISITSPTVKVKMKADLNKNKLTYTIDLYGNLAEYYGKLDISKSNELKELKVQAKKEIEEKTKELLQKFQKNNIDPLQIGLHAMKPIGKPLSDEEWYKKWRKMDIEVNYKLDFDIWENPKLYGNGAE